ncbi:MAG: hypothetical protein ACREFY_07145 [Acetobacteraceae bacterium]
MGLRRKRARIAGEIEATERKLTPLREALAQVDAVLRLFAPASNPELIPAIRPAARCLFFRHGEQMRLCVVALREAGGPARARQIAEYAMLAKGLPADNAAVRTAITVQVRIALGRLEKRGKVRRILNAPETWWELAPGARDEG